MHFVNRSMAFSPNNTTAVLMNEINLEFRNIRNKEFKLFLMQSDKIPC